ncbi:MAG TPA: RsbRD N-terminal domain-containing protein [Methylomirabilota bacterium]|nr:RsbRD N-terminal domain-containing protein [Methylomirabilota bacterium]
MSLHLSQTDRDTVVERWFDRIVDRYPVETARFLRDQQDPFANPVGAALREELAPILDGVLDDRDPVQLAPGLDRIVRIRALQDMSPSQAVGFVLDLKEIFDDVVSEASDAVRRDFDDRVDHLLLAAFDVYSGCREQVSEIRVREIRNRSLKQMERLNEWREQRAGEPSSGSR